MTMLLVAAPRNYPPGEGAAGAFVMGVRHGAYCLGCCWILMALLFVAGVMNLFWVVVIALLAICRKVLILDLAETDAWHLLSLAAAILALGIVYWIIRSRDQADKAAD